MPLLNRFQNLELVHAVLQRRSWLERNCVRRLDLDWLARTWVAAFACFAVLNTKGTELWVRETLLVIDSSCNYVECKVENLARCFLGNLDAFVFCSFVNFVDQF